MKTIAELLIIVGTLFGGFVYLSTEFASASDVERLQADISQIKYLVMSGDIHRRMSRYCNTPNNELKRRVESDRVEFHAMTGRDLPWICTAE